MSLELQDPKLRGIIVFDGSKDRSILLQVEDSLLAKEISTLESRLEKSAEKLNEEKEKTQSFRAELDQLEKEFAECSAEQKVSRCSMLVLVFV